MPICNPSTVRVADMTIYNPSTARVVDMTINIPETVSQNYLTFALNVHILKIINQYIITHILKHTIYIIRNRPMTGYNPALIRLFPQLLLLAVLCEFVQVNAGLCGQRRISAVLCGQRRYSAYLCGFQWNFAGVDGGLCV